VQKLQFTDSVPKLVHSDVDGDLNTVTKDILDRVYHIAKGYDCKVHLNHRSKSRQQFCLGHFQLTKIKDLAATAASAHAHCLQASFQLNFLFSRRFQTLLALFTRPYQSNKSWKVSESKSRCHIMPFPPFVKASCLRQEDDGEPAKSTLD